MSAVSMQTQTKQNKQAPYCILLGHIPIQHVCLGSFWFLENDLFLIQPVHYLGVKGENLYGVYGPDLMEI